MIPDFRDDGYLPEGIHHATEAEVIFRFGAANTHRRQLALRLRDWLELTRSARAQRFLLDGSFITAKNRPNDIDAVVWLADDFEQQLADEFEPAITLEGMLRSHRPEELFAAEDSLDWRDWVEFFSRTREADNRRKGLVEIEL